jgi:hypothetical protein
MPNGFGKPPKAKSPRAKKYRFKYLSSDGYINVVEIEAFSREEAAQQFQFFVRDLEFSLRVAADQQILPRIEGELS